MALFHRRLAQIELPRPAVVVGEGFRPVVAQTPSSEDVAQRLVEMLGRARPADIVRVQRQAHHASVLDTLALVVPLGFFYGLRQPE